MDSFQRKTLAIGTGVASETDSLYRSTQSLLKRWHTILITCVPQQQKTEDLLLFLPSTLLRRQSISEVTRHLSLYSSHLTPTAVDSLTTNTRVAQQQRTEDLLLFLALLSLEGICLTSLWLSQRRDQIRFVVLSESGATILHMSCAILILHLA